MYELARIKRVKAGTPPGTVEYAGPAKDFSPTVEILAYSPQGVRDLDEIPAAWPETQAEVLWVRVRGVHDVGLVRRAGRLAGLSDVLLEDVLNVSQRPKMEEGDSALLAVAKSYCLEDDGLLREEQLSLVLAPGLVVTFGESADDPFGAVAKRIRQGKGRIRGCSADYLLLALLDSLVDDLFRVLGTLGEDIEALEQDLLEGNIRDTMEELYRLRRVVLVMSRSARPLRELVLTLRRDSYGAVREDNLVYARDLADHGLQAVELLESYREALAALLELAMTTASIRVGEITRVLTVFAAIFIPLTFIAGVYGMNFQRMPELAWPWGYPMALGIMAVVAVALIIYFRRKDWL